MNDNKALDNNKQNLVEKLVSVDRISFNVNQSVIVTTEDKIYLSLGRYLQNEKRRVEWIAPLSLLLAIITTLVTATFQDFILSGSTWKAIFIVTGIVAVFWLIRSLLFLGNRSSIEDLIKEIKTGNQNDDSRSAGGSI
ncbi:MAG: hypothetical protein D3921_02755 [Candidatus Electrothrix sp. AW1]|nr:hypothetical protein [Candidatus Electrothrix sp. AX1]MCI5181446.1 hypothetical protein [Candidatus Electrothrix gigas]